jgi:hypothetical protein
MLAASAVSGQEQPAYADIQIAPYLSELEHQLKDNAEFLNKSVEKTETLLKSLSKIDSNTGLPQSYDENELSGLSQSMMQYRQAQSAAINEYADLLSMRIWEVSENWNARIVERSSIFLEKGSLYDSSTIEIGDKEAFLGAPLPNFFSEWGGIKGGFFAPNNNVP